MKNVKLPTGKNGNDGKPIIQSGESNDDHVKLKLREMGQVICYFGEGRMIEHVFYLEFSY